MSKYIGIRIPDELEAVLLNISQSTNKPKSFHVKKALEQYIEDFSDYLEGMSILNSNNKTYSFDEVKQELGLT